MYDHEYIYPLFLVMTTVLSRRSNKVAIMQKTLSVPARQSYCLAEIILLVTGGGDDRKK